MSIIKMIHSFIHSSFYVHRGGVSLCIWECIVCVVVFIHKILYSRVNVFVVHSQLVLYSIVLCASTHPWQLYNVTLSLPSSYQKGWNIQNDYCLLFYFVERDKGTGLIVPDYQLYFDFDVVNPPINGNPQVLFCYLFSD